MPKIRLTEIADDMGISFEAAMDIVTMHLAEDMVSGRGKNTWVTEDGQTVIDSYVTVPQIFRGKILSVCPNNKFSYVYIKEMLRKVPIKLPRRLQGPNAVGKYIYIEVDNSEDEPKFKWTAPPTLD
jgi:hypothetical protein